MDRFRVFVVLIVACLSVSSAKKHHGKHATSSHRNHTRSVFALAAHRALGHNKIVGGEPATIEEFPYQVAVLISESDGDYQCGGSILNAQHVLTAAHCVYGDGDGAGISKVVARVGSSNFDNGKPHEVEEFIIHPEYDPDKTNHDVAVLKLRHKIKLNGDTIKAIELTNEEPAAGSDITIAGWGTTEEDGDSSDELLKVTVPVVSREDCNDAYGGGITEYMICAGLEEGGKDSCQGDSGGPAVDERGVQVGVVSFGVGCARPGVPGVYSNVAALRDFIDQFAEE